MSVEDELAGFSAAGREAAAGHGPEYQRLWAALGDAVGGGKRLRSRLLLAAHRAYAGPATDAHDVRVAERVAAAVELLHTAFVVHDDVIDHDLRRHGVPNVAGDFVGLARRRGVVEADAQTLGLAAGVLAGDLALVAATAAVARCGADPATVDRLLDRFTDAVVTSAAGELDDVALGVLGGVGGVGDPASLSEVLTIAEHKTAAYTFCLPLQLGATLAGAPATTVEQLGTVGRLAGLGFQLVDDLRGVFAEEAETGKSALGDLREGKLTPLVAHARGTTAWPALAPYVGDRDLTPAGAGVARGLLEACGSRAFVAELADGYLTAAVRQASDVGLAPALVAELGELCHRIRESAAA